MEPLSELRRHFFCQIQTPRPCFGRSSCHLSLFEPLTVTCSALFSLWHITPKPSNSRNTQRSQHGQGAGRVHKVNWLEEVWRLSFIVGRANVDLQCVIWDVYLRAELPCTCIIFRSPFSLLYTSQRYRGCSMVLAPTEATTPKLCLVKYCNRTGDRVPRQSTEIMPWEPRGLPNPSMTSLP